MQDLIRKGKNSRPPRVIVYGVEGIGKSSFGAGAPAPIFLPTEDGLGEIDCESLPLATSYAQFLEHLGWVCTGDHGYQTVVVDTLDWLEKLIWADVCWANGKTQIEDIGYAKGYQFALKQWAEVTNGLDYARGRGMCVLLLAHAKIEKFNDPESAAYDRYTLRLHKDADAYVCEWADAVLFACHQQRTEKTGTGFRERTIAKAVGADGGERILRTVRSPACSAKNRYGITGDLPLSWEAFAAHLG